ncbi:fluoride efflux transporter FluC [Solicola gregarius]|uniref:Fluoride-specific ion channel FluC n=1 Tax=Solicola gregarius TaxID=2908642 RepID=A0AA46TL55_9ACTN|nr:CrcB family protein [Solicola gregarius]UYM06443.1 CrcB family protein [Solicola gregarius]
MTAPASYGRDLAYASVLVVVGGIAGTLCRYGTAQALPTFHGWPVATMLVNVVGAFALGLLIERLAAIGPGSARLRHVRLLAGTGFLGSFTTYSSLAVETERLIGDGAYGTGVGYLVATLALGLVACLGGVAVASRPRRYARAAR